MISPEELFNKYKLEGLIPEDFVYDSSLTYYELKDLFEYKPVVKYSEWIEYLNMVEDMTIDEIEPLKTIKIIYPELSLYDLFFYATRGWIPYYEDINKVLDRWNKYETISSLLQSFLDDLYSPYQSDPIIRQRNFAIADYKHPLELLILALDTVLEDHYMTNNLSIRYGFGILSQDIFAYTTDICSRITEYIYTTKASLNLPNPLFSNLSLEELLNFSELQYQLFIEKLPLGTIVPFYSDRVYGQIQNIV